MFRVRVWVVTLYADCSRCWFFGIPRPVWYISSIVAIYLEVLHYNMWFVDACGAVGTDIRYLYIEFDEYQWVEIDSCNLLVRHLLGTPLRAVQSSFNLLEDYTGLLNRSHTFKAETGKEGGARELITHSGHVRVISLSIGSPGLAAWLTKKFRM